MCQSLVDKVARSRQLLAIAHPEILVLFENWLEELEEEVLRMSRSGALEAVQVAEAVGLSRSGVNFLLAKLRHEGRID
nr:hypothetical protein [Desulfonatronum thioautotrophicum]